MSIAPYILETVTPPQGDVVTLEEMQTVLRFDDSAEDNLIQDKIDAAVEYVQQNAGKQLLTATYDLKLFGFPSAYGPIEFPRLPVQSVTSVKYYDTGNTLTTMTVNTHYTVQLGTDRAKGYILPAYGLCWPTTRGHDRDVIVRFVCGFGDADDVPGTFKEQIKALVHHWFNNRSAVSCGAQSKAVLGFEALAAFNAHQEFI